MVPPVTEELLILTKTYPAPSTRYRELTCVAAVNRSGAMRRLFPIPYRFLADDKKFGKWMWIRAPVTRASDDKRPESYHIDVDSMSNLDQKIDTRDGWAGRRLWVEPHVLGRFSDLEARRQQTGETLGFIRPRRLVGLDIKPARSPDWTNKEKAKLVREGLFDSATANARALLKKVPYNFYYRYECVSPDGVEAHRHKITDWEAGALYWKCRRRYGAQWEAKFRQRLETEFAKVDLQLLMGTIHRFPDKWLIVGLFYPPRQMPGRPEQLPLGWDSER